MRVYWLRYTPPPVWGEALWQRIPCVPKNGGMRITFASEPPIRPMPKLEALPNAVSASADPGTPVSGRSQNDSVLGPYDDARLPVLKSHWVAFCAQAAPAPRPSTSPATMACSFITKLLFLVEQTNRTVGVS